MTQEDIVLNETELIELKHRMVVSEARLGGGWGKRRVWSKGSLISVK